jgi:hypothetical protein
MKKRKYTTRQLWHEKLEELKKAHPGQTLKQIWQSTYNRYGNVDKAAAALGVSPSLYTLHAKVLGLVIVSKMVDYEDAPISFLGFDVDNLHVMHDSSMEGV